MSKDRIKATTPFCLSDTMMLGSVLLSRTVGARVGGKSGYFRIAYSELTSVVTFAYSNIAYEN